MKINKFTVGAGNQFKPDALDGAFNNPIQYLHVTSVGEVTKGPDGKLTFRVRGRKQGREDDQGRLSDEVTQIYDVAVPATAMQTTPYLRPGDVVTLEGGLVKDKVNWYPVSPTLQGESPSKSWLVPSLDDVPGPRGENESKRAWWPGYDIAFDITTNESKPHKHNYIKSTQESHEKPREGKNRFDEKRTRYVAEKTTGAHKYDVGKDAQKFIQKSINNEGAFVPSALQMIQQLKKLGNGQNPNSINAVGSSNFMNGLKELKSHFSKQQPKQENPCAILETNPESLSQAQIDRCCSPENRRNLTPKQKEYCEYLESLLALAEEETEVISDGTQSSTV